MIIPGMKRQFAQSDVINPSEYTTSFSRAASASDSLVGTELPMAATISGMRTLAADVFGDTIDKEKAANVYRQNGIEPTTDMLEGSHTFEGVSRRASVMSEQRTKDAQIARARSSTALTTRNIVTGFGMQFLDPMNYATAGLAFMAAPAFVAGVTTKGLKAGKAANVALRYNALRASQAGTAAAFGRGVVEGLAGNALLEVPLNPLLNYTGYDYTLTDSLLSIGLGAPFGGVVHAAPKVWRNYRGKVHSKKLQSIKDALPDDLRPIVDADIADSEMMDIPSLAQRGATQDDSLSSLIESAEDAGFDVSDLKVEAPKVDPDIAEATKVKAELERIQSTVRGVQQETAIKNLIGYQPESLSQFVRRTGGIENYGDEFGARDLKSFGKGAGLVKKPKAKKGANSLFDTEMNNTNPAAIDNVKSRVFDAKYFPDKTDYNQISDSELFDAITKDANEKNLTKRIYDEVTANRLADALENDESRYIDDMGRMGISSDMSPEDIASVLRDAKAQVAEQQEINKNFSGIINASDDAAEMIQAVSPDTRFAAYTTAVSQMANGNRVNVEPIIAMDSRSGLDKPSPDDIAKAFEDDVDEDYLEQYDTFADVANENAEADFLKALEESVKKRDVDEDIPFEPRKVADVQSAVRKSFGKHTDAIMDAARIKVVQSVDEVFTPDNLPKLPKALSGAKPRYGYGTKQFTLAFESDVDKAIYTVGNVALDKKTGQLKRSKSHAEYVKFLANNGISEQKARELASQIKDKIKAIAKDAEAGELIIKSQSSGFYSKEMGDIAGVKMPDGTVYLVVDNIDPQRNIQGLVLHEIGVHVGMRNMLGDVQFNKLLDDVMTSDNPRVRQARERVPDDTPPEHIAEETLAYLVEYAPHDDFVSNIIGAIKAWLMRTFKMKFSVDEFTARHLAIGSLRRVSQMGEASDGRTMMSRTDKTVQGEQMVIAGAEKISDKQLAERKMEGALKAKKPQQRMDEGLFGEPDRQTTLFSRTKKPEAAKPEAKPKLSEITKLQDDMLRAAETYKPAIADAIRFLGDDAGMRKRLEQGGVQRDMLQMIIDTANAQNRFVTQNMRKQVKVMKNEDMVAQLDPEMQQHAERIQAALKEKIEQDKKNAILNAIAQTNMFNKAISYGDNFAFEGVASTLVGSSMLRNGARDNVASAHKNYVRNWVFTLEAAMKREGVLELFTKNVHERDVAKALERMDDKKPDFTGINKDALKIAAIVYKVRENARMTQNSFGANIRQFNNYVVRQSHDQNKVHNSTFKEWYDYIKPRLDMRAMNLNEAQAEGALRKVYNEIASGNYEVELPTEPSVADYRAGSNIATKVSKSRSLIFKRDMWFDYNKKYGSNTLSAALYRSLDKAARDSALMRFLGVNPEYNLKAVIDKMNNHLAEIDAEAARKFKQKNDSLLGMLETIDGRANIAGNVTIAKIDTNLRLFQMMAKLGGSTITSIADLGVYAANTRYEGRGNLFKGIANAVAGTAQRYGSGGNKEILDGLGLVFEHTIADTVHQFSKSGTFSDNMAASARVFTKLNLQIPWTTRLQKSASIGLSNHLAKHSDKAIGALPDELKRMFKLHNINGAKWDVIRKSINEAEDGRMFVDTRKISNADDAVITKYLQDIGRTVSPQSLMRAREAIAADVRTMFIDRAESAVLSSDSRVQSAMIGRTKAGTFWGVMVRQIGQFKSFPLLLWERVLKREVYGRGYDSMGDYWARGKGDMVGLANFMVTMTVLGYISMSLKDAIAQKKPRPLDKPGTWIEAMRRGGALGLYGDFLLQEYDRHAGAGLAESILGPSFGAAGDIAEIVTAAINGDKFATKALRALQSNTPGANLFYIKPALDNLIMWNMYEAISPGFLRRSQQNVKERGQEFFLSPAESTLRY